MKPVALFLLCLTCLACSPKTVTKHPIKIVDHGADPKKLVWRDPGDPTPLWLGNGQFGSWIGRDGTGFGLEAFSYSLKSQDARELSPAASPLDFQILINGSKVDVRQAKDYQQTMDFETRRFTTSWNDPAGAEILSRIALLDSRIPGSSDQYSASIQLQVTITCTNRSQILLRTRFRPESSKQYQSSAIPYSDSLNPLQPTPWTWNDIESSYAGIAQPGQPMSIIRTMLLDSNKPVNSRPEDVTISIDGPSDDQQVVSTILANLQYGVNPNGPTAPFGLSNQRYGLRAFWDSDTWMFPALALLDPNRAKSIPQFRIATGKAAEGAAYKSIADAREQFHPSVTPFKYPWEAGPTGLEMAPGESKKQMHITADVALAMSHAAALGLVENREALTVVKGCGQYLWHRSTKLADGTWGVLDTMSPDEFHTGDNDLYTNIATEMCLRMAFPDRWKQGSFKRPRDSKTYLTYDGDQLKFYKQAAALLAIWPLQDPACEKEAGAMLERFSGKTTANGPAMSQSVEALIRARFGDKEVAYQEWRGSWQRYTKRPMMMFSEAPNGKNAYFLTGAAGCLDAFLYGFVGLRIDDHDPGKKPWKIPLRNGSWLSCEPHLPAVWKSVTIDSLTVLGKKYRLKVMGTGVIEL